MNKIVNSVHVANILLALAQVIGPASAALGLGTHPYVLAAQAILAALLPSLGGIGHKVAFGEAQDPAAR